eukprot:6192804-Pleurochrysis_carterae.AAC.2
MFALMRLVGAIRCFERVEKAKRQCWSVKAAALKLRRSNGSSCLSRQLVEVVDCAFPDCERLGELVALRERLELDACGADALLRVV